MERQVLDRVDVHYFPMPLTDTNINVLIEVVAPVRMTLDMNYVTANAMDMVNKKQTLMEGISDAIRKRVVKYYADSDVEINDDFELHLNKMYLAVENFSAYVSKKKT